MGPVSVTNNTLDDRLFYSILDGKCPLGAVASAIPRSNVSHLRLRQFVMRVLFAFSRVKFSLLRSICCILLMRSKLQMLRANTRFIIAFVHHFQSLGNLPIVHNPRHSVSWHSESSKPKATVPTTSTCTNPLPAWTEFWAAWLNGTVLQHFSPKTFFYCSPPLFRKSFELWTNWKRSLNLILHKVSSFDFVPCPLALAGAGAPFIVPTSLAIFN